MTEVLRLTQATKRAAEELAALGSMLHGDTRTMDVSALEDIVRDEHIALVVAQDGEQVVGMGTLYIIPKIGKRNAYIEDIIVSEQYRGQGLGEKITRELISIAKQNGINSITLTSNPKRVAAHALYEKVGFQKKETDVFKLTL